MPKGDLDFRIFSFRGKQLQGMVPQMKFLYLTRYFHSFFSSFDVNSAIKPIATLSQEKKKTLPSNLYITKFLALNYKWLLAVCTSPGVCVGVAAFNSASGTSWVWFVRMCGSNNQNIAFSLGIQSVSVCSPEPAPEELSALIQGGLVFLMPTFS